MNLEKENTNEKNIVSVIPTFEELLEIEKKQQELMILSMLEKQFKLREKSIEKDPFTCGKYITIYENGQLNESTIESIKFHLEMLGYNDIEIVNFSERFKIAIKINN